MARFNVRLFFCAYLACVNTLVCQEELIQSAASPKIVRIECGEELLLEGIVLIDADTPLLGVKEEPGVHVKLGLKSDDEALKVKLRGYLNHPLNEELIHLLKNAIIDYFYSAKNQYVAPIIPEQDISDGIIVIQVLSGRVGSVTYQGQKWFSEKEISGPIHLKPGDPIIENELMNNLAWLNRHPFHNTQMILAPGVDPGTTDLEFITRDRFPARFFFGADNTGYRPNVQTRLYAGFNWGDAFMIGDLLSYQYTASPNVHTFQAHVLNYTSFLSAKQVLTIFGSYGTVFPNIPGFTSSGKGLQGSCRYQIPFLPLYGDFRHYIELGFDFKYTNSNLFFLGDPEQIQQDVIGPHSINVTQFLTSYSFVRNWTQHAFNFKAEIYSSFWKDWFIPHQTSSAYAALRPNSKVRYGYTRLNFGDRYRTNKKWIMLWNVQGQVATGALPTSEQFGLGGAATVRGYFEQQFVADNAFLLNLELYPPTFPLSSKIKNEGSVLVFLDYGYGYNYKSQQPDFVSQHLLGIGAGFRFDVIPYLFFKADWGFLLSPIPGDNRIGRLHVSANASY